MAFLAALIYISHPIQVESVAWVITVGNLLSALFVFVSILFYVKSQGKFDKFYALSLVCFVLSIFSKYYGIVTPLLIALYDYQRGKFTLKRYLPYFAIAAVLAFPLIQVAKFSTISRAVHWTPVSYLATASGMFFAYFKNYFYPARLYPLYENEILADFSGLKALWGLTIFLFLFLLALLTLRRKKEISFGILFLFITLLPVSQIIPLDRAGLIADRYLFIPSLGLAIVIGWFFAKLIKLPSKIVRFASLFIFLVIISILSFLTLKQTRYWKDHETLWNYLVGISPLHPFVQNKPAYFGNEVILKEKLSVFPRNPYIPFEMAKIELQKGNLFEAESLLNLALSLSPDLPEAQKVFNELYLRKGLSQKVLAARVEAPLDNLPQLEDAFAKDPGTLGIIYSLKGAFAEAEKSLLVALSANASDASVVETLVILYEKMGEKAKANEYLAKLNQLTPNSFFVRNKLK